MPDLGASSLAITQSIGLFTDFLPKLHEVRKANRADPEFKADVRLGEIAATGLMIGTGMMVKTLTGSSEPLQVAIVMCIFLVTIYEYALNCNPVQPLGVE